MVVETDRPGRSIGDRFVLIEQIGQGAFGSVWSAEDQTTQTMVAVKILRGDQRDVRGVTDRFRRESEILVGLAHSNIARLITSGLAEDGTPYFALELLHGPTLREELDRRAVEGRGFELVEIASIVQQLVGGTEYAHSRGIVHRDLKPSNVVLTPGEPTPVVKVLDFGVAKIMQRDRHDATTVGRVFGSILYVAPEQFLAQPIDPRADVFALGTILFEMLTLRRMWARNEADQPLPLSSESLVADDTNNYASIMQRIVYGPRPRPSQWRAGSPGSLDAVAAKSVASRADERYPSAGGLGAALEEVLGRAPDSASTPSLAISSERPPLEEVSVRATITYFVIALSMFALSAVIISVLGRADETPTDATILAPAELEPAGPQAIEPPRAQATPQEPPKVETTASSDVEPVRPSVRTHDRRAARRARRSRPASTAPTSPATPPPAPRSALRRLLERAQQQPDDAERIAELVRRIEAQAPSLGPVRGRSIIRQATLSQAVGDLEGLRLCVEEIEKP